MECPLCKSNKVGLVDYQPLYLPAIDNVEQVNGDFDDELYAEARCLECESSFNIVGRILWPEIKASNLKNNS